MCLIGSSISITESEETEESFAWLGLQGAVSSAKHGNDVVKMVHCAMVEASIAGETLSTISEA